MKPASIKGGGVYLGGWTPTLGPYVYHPSFEPVVTEQLRLLGLPTDPIKNHAGYGAADARRALAALAAGETPEVDRR